MTIGIGRCFAISAAISMTVGVLSLASAWVFYEDDRRPSHSAMVGTLEIDLPEGTGLGTAVLVDGCGILTNFHAVFGPWYVTALRPPSREFPGTFTLTEATRPDGAHPTARAIPVVWGDYRGPDRQVRVPDRDWAYLVLDQCLGLEYGHLNLHALDLDELAGAIDGFVALGYSTGQQMVDPACSVNADRPRSGNKRWLHDCALEAGDSGGPIIQRATSAVVALSASIVADPSDPNCRTSGVRDRGAALSHFNVHCANAAVPLLPDIIDRIEAARVATGVQRALTELGYDAGPLGAIDGPRAIAAIKQAQRDMGWPVTGEPTDALRKILWLTLATS
jgi:Putative peptidoglycan binding domain